MQHPQIKETPEQYRARKQRILQRYGSIETAEQYRRRNEEIGSGKKAERIKSKNESSPRGSEPRFSVARSSPRGSEPRFSVARSGKKTEKEKDIPFDVWIKEQEMEVKRSIAKQKCRIVKISQRFAATKAKESLYSKRVLLHEILGREDYDEFTIVCITNRSKCQISCLDEFKFPKNLVHLILDDFIQSYVGLLFFFKKSDTPNLTTLTVEEDCEVISPHFKHEQYALDGVDKSKYKLPASLKTVITHDPDCTGLFRVLNFDTVSTVAFGLEYLGTYTASNNKCTFIYAGKESDKEAFDKLALVDPF